MAALYIETDRLLEALTMYSEAVKIFEQSLGTKHPNTIQTKKYLALCQKKLKDTKEFNMKFDLITKKLNNVEISDKSQLFKNKPSSQAPIDWKRKP